MNFEISKKADEDLKSIWLYTYTQWSDQQADRYFNQIFDEIEYLAKFPHAGKDFSFILPGIRASKIKSHLIFYRIKNSKTLEVLRVLHENMDFLERIND